MAHVQRRAGRWVARYTEAGIERSRTFARKLDAERFLERRGADRQRGGWVDPKAGEIALEDWSASWLATIGPRLKPKTLASYESLLDSRIVPELGGFQLGELRPSDVDAWVIRMQDAGLSASRIRQAHVVLGAMLDQAVRDERIARNVARGAPLPRLERREAAYLEPNVVEQIAQQMRPPYDLLVRILGQLGPRFGEAAALRRRSVDLLRRRLVIAESLAEVNGRQLFGTPKSHTTRRVPLSATLADAIEARLDVLPRSPDALLFTSPAGAPLRHSLFRSREWLPALARTGMPAVGLHVLRHSAAAAMIHAGADAKTVQTVLGHRSVSFTLTVYGHLFDADLDELAERLDALHANLGRDGDGMTLRPLARDRDTRSR